LSSFHDPASLVGAVRAGLESHPGLSRGVAERRSRLERDHSVETPVDDIGLVSIKRDGPKVSVFTAVYNAAAFVGETLESLLSQRAGDLEVLVLNDGSKDDTLAVVRKYESDPRIRLFDQPNIGQVGRFDLVWQSLIPHARGDFIASVDGDDISMPDHFERMLDVFAQDSKVGLVHSAGVTMDEQSKDLEPTFSLTFGYDETSQLRDLMYACLIAHSTILMRREAFDTLGWFESGFATDYQYWMRIARKYRMRYLPEKLIRYRLHGGASSRQAWSDEGNRTRRYERLRSSMLDLYPALVGSQRAVDYAAAHLDLGLRMVRGLVDPDRAFEEFDHAIALMDGDCPEAEWNRMILLLHIDRRTEAEKLFAQFHAKHPQIVLRYTGGGEAVFAEGMDMSRTPFGIPDHLRDTALCWDGTRATLDRMMLYPDHARPDLTNAAVNAYAEATSAADDVDLCLATLGKSEKDILDSLQSSPVGLHDLSDAASVTIERVDEVGYVPERRYFEIVNLATVPTTAAAAKTVSDAMTTRKRPRRM
jgi:teichuronic acid biosynthesis glycosyltransferase TuaG